ncbi:MAG: DUF885 domain-containing protein [Actinomycetota bacterium]|nr:DUF885 domain-containing protein [Actinomycetota bacterium]
MPDASKSAVDVIAEEYLARLVELDPITATYLGIPGHDTELNDFSPTGAAAMQELSVNTLARLRGLGTLAGQDRIAVTAMVERLRLASDLFGAGEYRRHLNVIESPLQYVRMAFDLMPVANEEDFATIAQRLATVPRALAGYRRSLQEGLSEGLPAPERQALAGAAEARAYSATGGYFDNLAKSYQGGDADLARRLADAAAAAAAAYDDLARWLERDYAPASRSSDYVGSERWQLACRTYNGLALDAAETYQWGWEELARIEAEMIRVAQSIAPGEALEAVMASLDKRPGYVIEGEENFLAWNQRLLDETMDALAGKHFDVSANVRRLEARLAPPGGAAAMYYTAPSADFSRPGRTWYPTMGRKVFPLWTEVSTAFHEGVPGHHMQIAQILDLGERINVFQRMLGGISGHTEGWALYAERLMEELGFLQDPVYKLGMLAAQAFRAARVVVDIGLHHQFRIPAGHRFLPAQVWTPELAVELIHWMSGRERAFSESEVDRYLGWPAQAISYKVGERVWLETREASRAARGSAFSLKDFHHRGFELGYVGLAQLREELGN